VRKISRAPWKTHLVNETVVVSADGEIVAQIDGDYDNDAERMAADAVLISLAPEMAEALRMMCDAADGLSVRGGALVGIDRVIDRTRDARALLAKLEAEG
jgi:hypothetical protein